jgi:hypothetical protein
MHRKEPGDIIAERRQIPQKIKTDFTQKNFSHAQSRVFKDLTKNARATIDIYTSPGVLSIKRKKGALAARTHA